MEWIEVNIPWGEDYSVTKDSSTLNKEFREKVEPEIEARGRALFGQTVEESRAKLTMVDGAEWERVTAGRPQPSQSGYDPDEDAEWLSQALAREAINPNRSIIERLKHQLFVREWDTWYIQQPEWLNYQEAYDRLRSIERGQYFRNNPNCKSGVELEVKTATGIKYLLIGDINTQGGVCDDCTELQQSDMVLRYRVVYDRQTQGVADKPRVSQNYQGDTCIAPFK